MSYDVFTKLYDSLVWPVIAYGAAIWGDWSFSCIDAVCSKQLCASFHGLVNIPRQQLELGIWSGSPVLFCSGKAYCGLVFQSCRTNASVNGFSNMPK